MSGEADGTLPSAPAAPDSFAVVNTTLSVTLEDVREAAARIAPWAHRTPVLTSASLDRLLGANLWFKCENLQRAGAFKFRGAMNAVSRLSQAELERGVATHSSGNHAAALALAAQLRGARSFIVMPRTAREVKKRAVAGYGGEISFCAPTLEARETTLQRVLDETGCVAIHPYNHPDILAGQGTAALELLEDVPDLDTLIAPVGGGGLLSGTAIAATELRPGLRVIGAEPAGADDAYRSMQAGRILPSVDPRTIADGLLTSLGELTYPVIRERVESIVTVSEQAIVAAMRLVWERMKIIIEPSSAVPVAALLEKREQVGGRRIGVIVSGGNVDLDDLPWAELDPNDDQRRRLSPAHAEGGAARPPRGHLPSGDAAPPGEEERRRAPRRRRGGDPPLVPLPRLRAVHRDLHHLLEVPAGPRGLPAARARLPGRAGGAERALERGALHDLDAPVRTAATATRSSTRCARRWTTRASAGAWAWRSFPTSCATGALDRADATLALGGRPQGSRRRRDRHRRHGEGALERALRRRTSRRPSASGLHTVAHAGEHGGPESIRSALEHCRAQRIDHGIRAIDDPSLVAHLAERGTALDVCPSSNVALGAVPSLEQHPFPQLRAAGVALTVNSDDPPFFGTSLTREYLLLHRTWGLSLEDLAALSLGALDHAFVPAAERPALERRFREEMADLGVRAGGEGTPRASAGGDAAS